MTDIRKGQGAVKLCDLLDLSLVDAVRLQRAGQLLRPDRAVRAARLK